MILTPGIDRGFQYFFLYIMELFQLNPLHIKRLMQ